MTLPPCSNCSSGYGSIFFPQCSLLMASPSFLSSNSIHDCPLNPLTFIGNGFLLRNPSKISVIFSAQHALASKTVAFTTPSLYAPRLQFLLQQHGAIPLWCPSIVVETTARTRQDVQDCLGTLESYSGIAFTSRAGIQALAEVLQHRKDLLGPDGDGFFVAALGRDAELLKELDVFGRNKRVKMVIPSVASPQALVEELGEGNGKHILCPVPFVENLEEPLVIPDFLQALHCRGWQVKRLNAYITRWAGPDCAKPLLVSGEADSSMDSRSPTMMNLDALVFTSTAEVEGLLKSLNAMGMPALRKGAKPVVAAHGPVTAAGAARLGVHVDIVNKNFQSFDGIIDSLDAYWKSASI